MNSSLIAKYEEKYWFRSSDPETTPDQFCVDANQNMVDSIADKIREGWLSNQGISADFDLGNGSTAVYLGTADAINLSSNFYTVGMINFEDHDGDIQVYIVDNSLIIFLEYETYSQEDDDGYEYVRRVFVATNPEKALGLS